jgi:hypothetical protein
MQLVRKPDKFVSRRWDQRIAIRRRCGKSRSRLNRRVLTVFIVVAAVMTLAFSKPKLVMSWKNPNYPTEKNFRRVLALGLSDKTEIRADFEDALAEQLAQTGVIAIPGHAILLRPESTQLDLNYLKTQIRENKIDAVVVSRLIKVEKNVTYIPGGPYVSPFPYYSTFYGYYRVVYPVVYSPDYLREEKKVRIETNLYNTASPHSDLVWTAVTDTFNPSNVHKTIKGLVKLVVKQMQSEGVL